MAKGDGPHWLDALGIDKTCRLVAAFGGMWTVTQTPDGTHTLWLFDQPQQTGEARTIRNAFADAMAGDWMERYFRA